MYLVIKYYRLYKNCETKVIFSLGYFHLCINILYTLIMNDKECIDNFIKVIIININNLAKDTHTLHKALGFKFV